MSRVISNKDIIVKFIPADRWWQRSKWQLMVPYVSHNGNVTAPIKYITDGASVPLMWRWRFSPTGRYFGASIVHDYILDTTGNWDLANREFNAEMKALNIPRFERKVLMLAVRLWAKLHRIVKRII